MGPGGPGGPPSHMGPGGPGGPPSHMGPGGPPSHMGGPPHGGPGGPPHPGPPSSGHMGVPMGGMQRAPSPGHPGGPSRPPGPGSPGIPPQGVGPQPPYGGGQPTDLHKLQNSISAMEERGMTNDPRYNQARQLQQSLMSKREGPGYPGPGGPGPGPDGPYSGGPPSQPGPGGDRNSFQNPQLLQLRAQIMAYRILARHQPLPPQIAMAVSGGQQRPASSESGPTSGSPTPPPTSTTPAAPPNTQAPSSATIPPTTSTTTGSSPAPPAAPAQAAPPKGQPAGTSSSGATQSKPNRVTPVARPVGIDPVTILNERENRLAGRIAHRIDELSTLPVSMAEDVKTKAEIELRALRLLNFQRSLRAEVVACTRRDTTLETAINVKAYKRTKRQGLREARATERLEKQQRVESERKRRAKHSEYINAVLNHSREMQSWHKANIAKVQKINKAILAWHANAEREQKKEQERIEKERLRRLMAEDREGAAAGGAGQDPGLHAEGERAKQDHRPDSQAVRGALRLRARGLLREKPRLRGV